MWALSCSTRCTYWRTEQLRKLGRLTNYYLDQFNQTGVFIRRKQENAKQRCSWNRGEWALSLQVLFSLGNVQLTEVKPSICIDWSALFFENMPFLYVVLMILCLSDPSASVCSWHASHAAWMARSQYSWYLPSVVANSSKLHSSRNLSSSTSPSGPNVSWCSISCSKSSLWAEISIPVVWSCTRMHL